MVSFESKICLTQILSNAILTRFTDFNEFNTKRYKYKLVSGNDYLFYFRSFQNERVKPNQYYTIKKKWYLL